MKLNLVFFGSPEFAADILKSVSKYDFINVRAVVTNPDSFQGRNKVLTPTPVASYAQDIHLPVFKPQKLDEQNLLHLKLFEPDIFLVVAYGKIIPKSYLDTPKIGTLNVHYSLLPKYRGALCVKEAIQNGDDQTGVTLMEMDSELDHGAIISQHILDIRPDHHLESLTKDLTQLSIGTLRSDLKAYTDYKTQNLPNKSLDIHLPPLDQNHTIATYTAKTKENTKANAFIEYSKIKLAMSGLNAKIVSCFIRANTPEPGAWTTVDTQKGPIKINIIQSHIQDDKLILDLIQIQGKNPISWKQFLSGYQIN